MQRTDTDHHVKPGLRQGGEVTHLGPGAFQPPPVYGVSHICLSAAHRFREK